MKRTNKYIVITIWFTMLYCNILAQITHDYRQLHVGDTVPDYELKNLINYPSSTARISAFKGKLLIIDLWSTYCASCIESWPKLLRLQKEFKDDVQILLLNSNQGETIVKKTIEKRKKLTGQLMTLPTICGDTILGNILFKHEGVPHVVWINRTGVILSITGGEELNSKNIHSILEERNADMLQKEFSIKINYNRPFFLNGNLGNGAGILFNSVLSKYIPGASGGTGLYADPKNGYSIYAINSSILDMYQFAYSKRYDKLGFDYYNPNLITELLDNVIVLNVKDAAKYAAGFDDKSRTDHLYNYQIWSTESSKQDLQEAMQKDLHRYFRLNAEWVKQRKMCLVLSARDTTTIKYIKGNDQFFIEQYELKLNNTTITRFIRALEYGTQYYSSKYPIIDETNCKGMIGGIDIQGINIYDHKKLDKALQTYNMSFKLEEREIDVLILTEAKTSGENP